MMNWGRVALGTVLQFMFTTYDGATGASEEGSGLATTDIEIYKAGGGLTQRSSDNGYALLDADGHALDSIVGLAGFTVDTGDNTDAGFFVAGGYYIVVVSSVTVDAQTVNFIAGTFSLGPTLTVAGVEEVDITHIAGSAVSTSTAQLGVNAVQAGGTAWGSGAITAASIATDAIGAAELADGAITAATFAAGAIDATAIANGAIDAATFAAGAIDAAALAADASTEINTAVLAVLGALNDAAADGAVTATDTMVAYLKQIINTLEGTPGIPTWPASAAPGNAVSIAEAVRSIYDQIGVAGAGLTAADDAVITAISGIDTKIDTIDNFLDTEMPALTAAVQGLMLVSGTIGAVANDTTHLHLTGLAYADDAINSMLITILDVSTGLYYSRWIEDFANAGDLATVATLPFTPQDSTDKYWILPVRADVTGGSGLDAAGVRAAVGLASANLDTQLDALPTNAELATALGTADDAVLTAIAALNNLSLANVRTGVLSAVVEGAETLQDQMRLFRAALVGKASGLATTSAKYRDAADSKDRITATVDADGNRTAIVADAT